jgi:hypothetical protein
VLINIVTNQSNRKTNIPPAYTSMKTISFTKANAKKTLKEKEEFWWCKIHEPSF